MKLHADLTERVVVNSEQIEWLSSPTPGVWRRMLERDGEEVARATTIVRFDPSCSFPGKISSIVINCRAYSRRR